MCPATLNCVRQLRFDLHSVKISIANNSTSVTHRTVKVAGSIGLSAMADQTALSASLLHDWN